MAARPVRIAVAQYQPQVAALTNNRAQAVHWAEQAAARGVDLLVLPELASSGYVFESALEVAACSEASDGPFLGALAGVAARTGMHIAAGFAERRGTVFHNSAALLGPQGVLAVYRKLHLFHNEQSWFSAGDDLPVVQLPFGRVGMVVCFDLWFPEAARALALAGAEVVAVPTNWVASFKHTVYDERGFCQGDYAAMVTAAQNGLVVACADRVGVERGMHFLGASLIIGADGWPLAGPAGSQEDALLVADVDLASVEQARQRTPRNHLLGDRRPDAYARARLVAAPQAAVPAD